VGETGSGFPEKLNNEQIRKCAARTATSKSCTLLIYGKEYSFPVSVLGLFYETFKKKNRFRGKVANGKGTVRHRHLFSLPHQG